MRTIVLMLSLYMLLEGCKQEPEATEQAPATEQPASPAADPSSEAPPAATVTPRTGGAVVATGDYAVEVVANADGAIDASVTTAAGASIAHTEVSALEVTAQGEGTVRHTIALGWDASRAMFHGVAKAEARLASGPLDVSITVGGKVHKGRLELAVVLPRPKFGGRMMVVGRYSAEVVPKIDGEIDVHLQDAAGIAVTADAGLDLGLRVTGKAGGMHAVALRWDPARACFKGRLEGGAELAAGPIELTAITGELKTLGRLEAVALLAPPSLGGELDADASLAAKGKLNAKAKAKAGALAKARLEPKAEASGSAKLSAKVPQPTVKANAKASGATKARAGGAATGATKTGVKLGGSLSTGISLGGK